MARASEVGISNYLYTILDTLVQSEQQLDWQVALVGWKSTNCCELLRRGVRDVLGDKCDDLSESERTYNLKERINRQIETIRTISRQGKHRALIVHAAYWSEEMYAAVNEALSLKTFVVAIENEPDRNRFVQAYDQPYYVGSNQDLGGTMLAEFVLKAFPRLENCRVLVLGGPQWSHAGSTRSKSLVYTLAMNGDPRRVHVAEITEWDTREGLSRFVDLYNSVRSLPDFAESDGIVCYCANDDNCTAIGHHIDSRNFPHVGKFVLLGYDGSKSGLYYDVIGVRQCAATIDVSPFEQGRVAAFAVLKRKQASLGPQNSWQLMPPKLLPIHDVSEIVDNRPGG